jgi:hypothetical protein
MRNLPRVYTSFMPNAPILNGVPGALLDVLKKCLVGGWTPFDILGITVASGVATIQMAATSASLPDYCRLVISGCDEPQLNKEWSITRGGNTTATFETTVADGTYGGAIKAAPEAAGWDLLFSGTNEAIIRSSNTDSSGTVVKITDVNATTAGFEFGYDARGINEIIDAARAVDNVERNVLKARNADPSRFSGWYVVCDNTTVYFLTDTFTPGGSNPHTRPMLNGGRLNYFGDYISNDRQETEAFAAYFQTLATGATSFETRYGNASPQWSGPWSEDYNMARSTVRMPRSAYAKWYWAIMNASPDIVNNIWRMNGGLSNLDMSYVSSLENTYRKIPITARVSGPGSAISYFGNLAGYRYTDYFIRSIFMPFTTSKDESGRVWLYVPFDNTPRDHANYNENMGMAPILMGRKWDE